MISIQALQKRFAHTWVLRDVNLEVEDGQFVNIFGPNGAGKTTLLRILSTLSMPNGGRVTIGGYDVQRDAANVRRLVGYVAHQPMLYADLTAEENLNFFAQLYDVSHARERITQLLKAVGLQARRNDRVRTFSRGMQQRLAIARALLPAPGVLLLDEPDDGLDPQAADDLRNYFDDGSQNMHNRSVLMTSHNLARGLALADRVALLVGGRIVYEATAKDLSLGELEEQYRQQTAVAATRGERQRVA